MKIIELGTGAAIFIKNKKGSAHLVDFGDKKVLLDCGFGITNLEQTTYKMRDIDAILITHPHVDHIGCLTGALQNMYVQGLYFPKEKRTKPLTLIGYKGFKQDYEMLRKSFFPERLEPYDINTYDFLNTKKDFAGLKIESTEIQHNPDKFYSVSYRLSYKNKVVVYSGDCGFDERLIKLSKNADVAIYEMANDLETFEKSGPKPNHLSAYEAAEIAATAKVKKLILVHPYILSSKPKIQKAVRSIYSGKIVIPNDLDTITF